MSFVRDLRVASHSLIRTPGLAIAVVLTLSLGIGANAAIFTLVRGVLLKPLVNRDEGRLIYIRQSAPGIGEENAAFSVRGKQRGAAARRIVKCKCIFLEASGAIRFYPRRGWREPARAVRTMDRVQGFRSEQGRCPDQL